MGSLSFELSLLSRMPPEYRASVLKEIGLTEAAATELAKPYPWPESAFLLHTLEAHKDLFEPGNLGARPERAASGSSMDVVDHCFFSVLWPHLFWIVSVDSEGVVRETGFQNQAEIRFQNFDPSTVRPGLWTLKSLERLARSSKLIDGWSEWQVFRFDFDSSRFEGAFIFGLLTEWRRV